MKTGQERRDMWLWGILNPPICSICVMVAHHSSKVIVTVRVRYTAPYGGLAELVECGGLLIR